MGDALCVSDLMQNVHRMPSTHSSAVAFMATYIMMAAARLHLPPSLEWLTEEQERMLRSVGPLLAIGWAGLVTGSRLHLGRHTLPQILAGITFGGLFAVGCFMAYICGLDEVVAGVGEALVVYGNFS